uniref:growth hormone secretagogue receptor type 1-like n=1 Tax=Ciona intestinalis TaxID=7719 RepID=UPI000EF466E6|nr:growth hormone secretagogue receptor type 1-like [Ciona intestinalis]|eukprot:XP_026691624.1 growth hormone secretagogue receptor type 1-like [Ciona intestinalis]
MASGDEVFTTNYNNLTELQFTTDITERSSYKRPFNENGIIFTATVFFPLAIFGVLANLLTFLVIYNSPKLRSTFNFFIMSLCVSDFLSSFISLLFVYRRTWGFEEWTISDFLCKFYWAVDTGTSVSTSLHIIMFSLLRFVSVSFPHKYNRIKFFETKIIIVMIWIISAGGGAIPWSIWTGAVKIDRNVVSTVSSWPSCTVLLQWINQFKSYTVYGYIVFYYVPFALVLIMSVLVTVSLHYKRKYRLKGKATDYHKKDIAEIMRRRKENQAIVQLFLIVGSFFIGYIPRTGFHVFSLLVQQKTYEDKALHWWLGVGEYLCLRVSECLNPIFYNLASSKMRKETTNYLKRMCRVRTGGVQPTTASDISTFN